MFILCYIMLYHYILYYVISLCFILCDIMLYYVIMLYMLLFIIMVLCLFAFCTVTMHDGMHGWVVCVPGTMHDRYTEKRRHATVRAAWHTTVAQWGLASFRENWRFKMRHGLYNARFVTPAV